MDALCPWPFSLAPTLCRSIDVYCERTSAAFDAEPLNALSGVAMLVPAIAATILLRSNPDAGSRGVIVAMIAAITVGAFGAGLFHTTAVVWTVWVDMMPFLVFMLLALWFALTALLGWSGLAAGIAVAVFLAVTFGAGPLLGPLLPPGAYYLTPLAALLAVSLTLAFRRSPAAPGFAAASATFLAALAARSLDAPLCGVFPAGTHFLWHLLAALLAWIILRTAILYGPRQAHSMQP